jgi:hypothetical protein
LITSLSLNSSWTVRGRPILHLRCIQTLFSWSLRREIEGWGRVHLHPEMVMGWKIFPGPPLGSV